MNNLDFTVSYLWTIPLVQEGLNILFCLVHIGSCIKVIFVFLLLLRRFELEYEANNACVDFVDIHDGSNLSSTKLNPTALCGDSADSNYTSTNNAITVYFQTDGTGQRTGFDFLFVVFSTGKPFSQANGTN